MNAAIWGQRGQCRHSPGAGGMEAGSLDRELHCRWRLAGRGGEGLRVNEETSLTHNEGSCRGAGVGGAWGSGGDCTFSVQTGDGWE